MTQFASLFSALDDPRAGNARRHSRHDILVIAFGVMLCGGQTGADMEIFGRSKRALLQSFLKLDNGIPSHDTGSLPLGMLDPPLSSSGSSALCGSLPKGNEGILAADAKSNEITALPWPLEMLTLRGKVVTADAMRCQRQVAQQVIEQGGGYTLALKGNHGRQRDDAQACSGRPGHAAGPGYPNQQGTRAH